MNLFKYQCKEKITEQQLTHQDQGMTKRKRVNHLCLPVSQDNTSHNIFMYGFQLMMIDVTMCTA